MVFLPQRFLALDVVRIDWNSGRLTSPPSLLLSRTSGMLLHESNAI
jgi:hypothetical protein